MKIEESIIYFLIIISLVVFIFILILSSITEFQQKLNDCKNLGYDGVKDISDCDFLDMPCHWSSPKWKCANFIEELNTTNNENTKEKKQ